MDIHTMKRKDLQALCKRHKIPANRTNREMANRLSLLLQAEFGETTKRRSTMIANKRGKNELNLKDKEVILIESSSSDDESGEDIEIVQPSVNATSTVSRSFSSEISLLVCEVEVQGINQTQLEDFTLSAETILSNELVQLASTSGGIVASATEKENQLPDSSFISREEEEGVIFDFEPEAASPSFSLIVPCEMNNVETEDHNTLFAETNLSNELVQLTSPSTTVAAATGKENQFADLFLSQGKKKASFQTWAI